MSLVDTLAQRGEKLHIVEIGASVPLAFHLLSLPGASKVVHCSESPYGTAVEKYGIKCRMVSEEAVNQIALKTAELYDDEHPEVNMIVVTSFQIQSNNNIIPHGWVAILSFTCDNWVYGAYHFTYWDNRNYCHLNGHEESQGKYPREWSIDMIRDNLFELLENEFDHFNQSYLDISTCTDILTQKHLNTLACFVDGKPVRFEDYSRKYENLILYKGSFNPVHIGHLEIARDAQERCPNSMVVFAISRDTYQKGRISNEDLMKRIKDINDRGYMAMVFDSGFFYDNYRAVSLRFAGKTHIALGADSFNRLIKCYETEEFSELERANLGDDYFCDEHERDQAVRSPAFFEKNFGNAHFYVYGRRQELQTGFIKASHTYVDFDVDVSSTSIRQLMESGNSDEAKKLTGKGE
jgi:hypothetical protein